VIDLRLASRSVDIGSSDVIDYNHKQRFNRRERVRFDPSTELFILYRVDLR
jgi:hypothetical protein